MVYKWYILPIGGLYATYHLLRGTRNNHWFWVCGRRILGLGLGPSPIQTGSQGCTPSNGRRESWGGSFHCGSMVGKNQWRFRPWEKVAKDPAFQILPLLDNLQDFLTCPTCKKLGRPSTQILYAIMPYQRDRCAFPGRYPFVKFLGCWKLWNGSSLTQN